MFGATTPGAQQFIRWGVWVAGGLLALKWLVRLSFGFSPHRWSRRPGPLRWPVRAMAVLTLLLLAYGWTSLWNARSVFHYDPHTGPRLDPLPRSPIPWLPSSYDADATRAALWNITALAVAFWAARDWFLGLGPREASRAADGELEFPNARSRLWLWVLCVNGAALSLVCILQRLDHSDKLLWVVEPFYTGMPDFIFGPYSYRTNAAQYFNLLWPLGAAFWFVLRRESRGHTATDAVRIGGPHWILAPCVALMALAPPASLSRGGALIFGGLAVCAAVILRPDGRQARWTWLWILLGILTITLVAGGEDLTRRFMDVFRDQMSGRLSLYPVALRMATDYPWWGSGPGTFATIYPFYRPGPEEQWVAYAHNDWLEGLITFGRAGLTLIIAALTLAPIAGWAGVSPGVPKPVVGLVAAAIAGMLIHAAFDFPFQVFSLAFTFTLSLAWVTTFGHKGLRPR